MIQDEMIINGNSIKRYHARLLSYSIGGTELSYSKSSPGTSLRLPDIFSTTLSPRPLSITLTFFPKAIGADNSRGTDIYERLSLSTANIVRFETMIINKTVEIRLPDGYIYRAFLQSSQPPSFDATGQQDVEYNFLAIRQKARITKTVVAGGIINCISNTKTPFKLILTVPSNRSSITICDILIRSVAANTDIVIDSEKGLITANGENKFGDTEFVDFPLLEPGSNTVNCSASDAKIIVQYTPIYA